jgi:hypothetical protein
MSDPDATLPDFVMRLRRMGYAGNVRVEFPIYMVSDVMWTTKIMTAALDRLTAICRDTTTVPLVRVLRTRAALVEMDLTLKRRTTYQRVRKIKKSG